MRYALTIVLAAASVATTALATESVKSCAYQAKADYNKAYYSLLQRGPMTSLPDIIAQRRFFCLRFVRCSVDDVDSLEFRGAFNRCLQDEPPEKYDAEQHD